MKPNTIKTSFQTVNFEKHSAIVQCHVDKKRMWILNKEGDFDYSQIGHEPPLRISVDKNISPRRIWSNKRSTRFILETIDFSLYYFQTSDIISDFFYNSKTKTAPSSQTVGMKKFFRIGALKNGPVSTIFFDDEPKDPYATRQIFIIIKGGGVLILSIETLVDEETKEQTTIISDFYTFPTLFLNFNILDMRIFRFIEHKPSLNILEEIKNKADTVLSIYLPLYENNQYPVKIFERIKEFASIIENVNEKLKKVYKVFNTLKKIRDELIKTIDELKLEQQEREESLNHQQNQFFKKFSKPENDNGNKNKDDKNKDNKNKDDKNKDDKNKDDKNKDDKDDEEYDPTYIQGNLAFEVAPNKHKMMDEIEKFLKYEENSKKEIDSSFYIKICQDPYLVHPAFKDWIECVQIMKSTEEKSRKAVSKVYKVAYLYQQIYQLAESGRIKNLEEDLNNENEDDGKLDSSKLFKNDENHQEEEEEDKSESSKFNIEEFEFDLNFNADFVDKEKKNKEKKTKNNEKMKAFLSSIKSEIKVHIREIKNFLNGKKMSKYEKIIEFKQEIEIQQKIIIDINERLDLLKQSLKIFFEKQNIQPRKYDKDYEKLRDENFIENNNIEYLTPTGLNVIDIQVQNILVFFKESAQQSIDIYKSIESFCDFVKPYYEDVNITNVEKDPFNIIRNYIVILAEDRIIFGYSDEDNLIQIFESLLDNKKYPYIRTYEQKSNDITNAAFKFGKIDVHSRLIHKPLKSMPSHKRPTFYIICWDSENNCNVCFSLKFKRNSEYEKNDRSSLLQSKLGLYANSSEYRMIINDEDESLIFHKISAFELEKNMKLAYYQITPSGLLVVQNGQRADSKVVCYEISSLIQDETSASSKRGKILWYKEITDYSLLPILGCDYSLEAGLILFNSMNIRLIVRQNVDSESFNHLIEYKNPKLIMKVRKYLALTNQQKQETFFILLIYAMNQLFQYENALHYKMENTVVEYGELDSESLSEKVNEAKNAVMKHINMAPCSKMSIFLFLMNDKKLNEMIKYYISSDNDNDEDLFERFRRFRIEFLINLLESSKITNRQQETLFLIAYDLLIQSFSTQNNKPIFTNKLYDKKNDAKQNKQNNNNEENKETNDVANSDNENDDSYLQNQFQVGDIESKIAKETELIYRSYFIKSYTEEINLDVITSLTNRFGNSLQSPEMAYYVVKCFPILDPASFYSSENEWYIESSYSKIYKFLVKGSNFTRNESKNRNKKIFVDAIKLLQDLLINYQNECQRAKVNDYEKKQLNNKEIDKAINTLFLFGIENFQNIDSLQDGKKKFNQNKDWYQEQFSNFFKFIEKLNDIPQIPQTVMSLFIFIRQFLKFTKSDNFSQFDPVIHFMNKYYEKNATQKIDLLFSIHVSMGFKEIDMLAKSDKYDVTLAIYRLAKFRVQAAKLLEQLKMTSVSIDVVLDESATTAIKFASSLRDENTILYLVRTASRQKENKDYDLVYDNVIGSNKNILPNQLYDVLNCIPDDKMKADLNAKISMKLEEIDNKSNEELKKIHSLQEKLKSKDILNNSSFMLSSPLSSCDICHNSLIKNDFFVFPCGHVFHKDCYLIKKEKDDFDRDKRISGNGDHQSFTTNDNQFFCPLCGLAAIELIDTPFYSMLEKDDPEVNALSKNICGKSCYITELDNDFEDD